MSSGVKNTALDTLSDVYQEMLLNDFRGIGSMTCAEELRHEYSHRMTPKQLRALNKFIDFWEALEDLEHETKKRALYTQLQCEHVHFRGKK